MTSDRPKCRSGSTLVIDKAVAIDRRGTAVLFHENPAVVLPLGTRRVVVTKPTGARMEARASIESARMTSSREVLAMHFPDHLPSQLPAGSTITIVDP